jgi:type II secretory pathway component PulF
MPIAKGLRILAREVKDPDFRRLIEVVQQDIDEGKTLQEALSKFPEAFNSLTLEIVRAGESTGNLAVILDELNAHTAAMQRIRGRVIEAVMYPAFISTIIFSFIMFFLLAVAPDFEEMLLKRQATGLSAPAVVVKPADVEKTEAPKGADAPKAVEVHAAEPGPDPAWSRLPLATRFMFTLSDIVSWSPGGIPLMAILMVTGVVALAALLIQKMQRMGEEYDDTFLSLPIFGPLFEQAALMKVTRTMRDLLQNGVSMVETLRLASRTVGKNRIARKLDELRLAVEEGGSFSRNLAGGDVFPDTMVWKLQMAEEKGIIEDALGELAAEFDIGVDRQTALITKFLSPVLLVIMGGVVFVMFLACFVPLTQMSAGY